MKKPKWSNTFNSSLGLYGCITKAGNVAKKAGYVFLMWNDRIYHIKDDFETDYIVYGGKIVKK